MYKIRAKLDEEGTELQEGLKVEFAENIEVPSGIPVTEEYDRVIGEVEETEIEDGELRAVLNIEDEEAIKGKQLGPAYIGQDSGESFRVDEVTEVSAFSEPINPDFDNEVEEIGN